MPERIAMLVIHGIGQQKPYEPLDQFGRNLMESLGLGGEAWSIRSRLEITEDPTGIERGWVRASYVISPPPGAASTLVSDPETQIESISLFEYYWAPITQDKITYSGSLFFLMRAGLKPFLYVASNINAIWKTQRHRIPYVILKELIRQAFLFLPLLLLFAALLGWLHVATLQSLTQRLNTFVSNFDSVLIAVLLLVRCLYLYSSLRALRQSSQTKSGWQASPWWKFALLFSIFFYLFALPLWLSSLFGLFAHWAHWVAIHAPIFPLILGHWGGILSNAAAHTQSGLTLASHLKQFLFLDPDFAEYTRPILTIFLAFIVRSILVNYVGDVAVYANADQFASSYAARAQILRESTNTLSALLLEEQSPGIPSYDRVLVAGHSLGSVIAYDTMNQLLNRCRATPQPLPGQVCYKHLKRLRGLITFGSPLNKFFYFFREQIDARQTLRRQTLNLLYGFRLRLDVEGTDWRPHLGPPFGLDPDIDEASLEDGFRWINAYSVADPISGRIAFYDLSDNEHPDQDDSLNQKAFHYRVPGAAHLSYWNDPDFYKFVRERLL